MHRITGTKCLKIRVRLIIVQPQSVEEGSHFEVLFISREFDLYVILTERSVFYLGQMNCRKSAHQGWPYISRR